jgi:hypothetical protein
MTVKISKTTTRKEIEKALAKSKSKRKRINLSKYFGRVDFGIDGLTYQKKIRNEWS